jgi:hypothetical protein
VTDTTHLELLARRHLDAARWTCTPGSHATITFQTETVCVSTNCADCLQHCDDWCEIIPLPCVHGCGYTWAGPEGAKPVGLTEDQGDWVCDDCWTLYGHDLDEAQWAQARRNQSVSR